MKRISKIDNIQLKASIVESLEHNTEAMDYIENEKNRLIDLLKYRCVDDELSRIIEVLEYIQFSLKFLDDSYIKALSRIGG